MSDHDRIGDFREKSTFKENRAARSIERIECQTEMVGIDSFRNTEKSGLVRARLLNAKTVSSKE
jgi:hypothetical protein